MSMEPDKVEWGLIVAVAALATTVLGYILVAGRWMGATSTTVAANKEEIAKLKTDMDHGFAKLHDELQADTDALRNQFAAMPVNLARMSAQLEAIEKNQSEQTRSINELRGDLKGKVDR